MRDRIATALCQGEVERYRTESETLTRSDQTEARLTFVLRLTLRPDREDRAARDGTDEKIMGKLRCIETGTETPVSGYAALRRAIMRTIAARRAGSVAETPTQGNEPDTKGVT